MSFNCHKSLYLSSSFRSAFLQSFALQPFVQSDINFNSLFKFIIREKMIHKSSFRDPVCSSQIHINKSRLDF